MKLNIEIPSYVIAEVFARGDASALAAEIWAEFAESLNLSIYFGLQDAIRLGQSSVKIG